MVHSILVTNGGPHSAEKWAVTTAEVIFPVDQSNVIGDRLIAAKKLQTQIADALISHHQDNQMKERGALALNGSSQLDTELDPIPAAQAALQTIISTAKGTPWEDHFNKLDVQNVILSVVAGHFATASHIERQWHCKRNKNDVKAQAWLAQHHGQE